MRHLFVMLLFFVGFAGNQLAAQSCQQLCPPDCCVKSCAGTEAAAKVDNVKMVSTVDVKSFLVQTTGATLPPPSCKKAEPVCVPVPATHCNASRSAATVMAAHLQPAEAKPAAKTVALREE